MAAGSRSVRPAAPRARTPDRPGGRLLAALPAAAAATAEGAWVAVWYAALAGGSAASGGGSLGLTAFVVAAAVGLVAARQLRALTERRATRRQRAFVAVVTAGLVAGAAVLGLAAERPPATGDVLAWLRVVPGAVGGGEAAGLLLGFAVWRGTRHADPEADDLVTSGLVGWGTPLLAIPWLIGGLRPGAAFAGTALVDTLTFAASGLVAVGLTRLEALDRSVGVDWRQNRAWLALLIAVVGGTTLVALPAALVVGASIEAIGVALAGPVVAAARVAGRAVGALGDVVGVGAASGSGPGGEVAGPPSGLAGAPNLSVPSVVAGLAAVSFALGLVVIAYRIALRVRGGPPSPEPLPAVREERRIRIPRPTIRLVVPRLALDLDRRRRPQTATEAYLDLVARLGSASPAARRPGESPAAHARRLRSRHLGSFRLDLLAADVGLERFGARHLPERELRRAWGRARDPRLGREGDRR